MEAFNKYSTRSEELFEAYKKMGFKDGTRELVNFALLLEKQAYDNGYDEAEKLYKQKAGVI